MRARQLLAIVTAITVVAGCKKTGENEYQVQTPDVDVNVSRDTSTVRVPEVNVGTTTDTVNTPVMGTKKDTVIVDRPVVTGQKKTEIKRPTVDVKSP